MEAGVARNERGTPFAPEFPIPTTTTSTAKPRLGGRKGIHLMGATRAQEKHWGFWRTAWEKITHRKRGRRGREGKGRGDE